jgi:hypothetical protein
MCCLWRRFILSFVAPRPRNVLIPRVNRDGRIDGDFILDNRLVVFSVGILLSAGIEVFVFVLVAFSELGLAVGTGILLGLGAAVAGVALLVPVGERLGSLFLFL